MKRLKALLSCAAVSLAMYTRLPMPHLHWTIERMKYALGFFPLAGVLCGGAQALFLLLVRTTGVFGPSFRAAVLLALPIAVSGGIHRQLSDSVSVPQVDESHSSKFSGFLHPACQCNRLSDVGDPKFAASMSSVHIVNLFLSFYSIRQIRAGFPADAI